MRNDEVKIFSINLLVFIIVTFLISLVLGVSLALYITIFSSVAFMTTYPIQLKIYSGGFIRLKFIYPVCVVAISAFIIFFCRVFYIPLFTELSIYFGRVFRMGHYGYTALFMFSGVTVVLVNLLLSIVISTKMRVKLLNKKQQNISTKKC